MKDMKKHLSSSSSMVLQFFNNWTSRSFPTETEAWETIVLNSTLYLISILSHYLFWGGFSKEDRKGLKVDGRLKTSVKTLLVVQGEME